MKILVPYCDYIMSVISTSNFFKGNVQIKPQYYLPVPGVLKVATWDVLGKKCLDF